MGMKRRVRRFRRQYSFLSATQKWDCNRRAFALYRMRANNNHNRAR